MNNFFIKYYLSQSAIYLTQSAIYSSDLALQSAIHPSFRHLLNPPFTLHGAITHKYYARPLLMGGKPPVKIDEKLFKKLVDEGKTDEEIAQIMKISQTTARRKRAELYRKLAQEEEEEEEEENPQASGSDESEEEVAEEPPVDPEEMMKQDKTLVSMVPTNRPLIEAVIRNMSWWQQAVQDIGWRAIFLAVSTAESDKDVNQRLAGFKTEQEFVDYISSILSALYDAKKDAEKLLSLKEDLQDAQVTADLYKIYAGKLEKSVDALQTIVTSLISALPPETAQKLAVWAILQAYGTGALKSGEEGK